MSLSSESDATLKCTTSQSTGSRLCELYHRKNANPNQKTVSDLSQFPDNAGEELQGKECNEEEKTANVARKLAEIGDALCYSRSTVFTRGYFWVTNFFVHHNPDDLLRRKLFTRHRLIDLEQSFAVVSHDLKAKIFARQLALVSDLLDQTKGRSICEPS